MTPRRKFVAFRWHPESFTHITWDEANRMAHEAKRPNPTFDDAHWLDWQHALKRKDIEHRDEPPRFQALVAFREEIWQAGGGDGDPMVCFVVFCKEDHALKLITIRYATEQEQDFFYDSV